MKSKKLKPSRHIKFYKKNFLSNGGSDIVSKKGGSFCIKFVIFSLFIFVMKFLEPHLSYYGGEEEYTYFIPEINKEKSYISNDGFILQKSIQTQKRKKTTLNKIIEHEIVSGETLSKISIDYQLKISTLLSANPSLSLYKKIIPGKKIKILPVDGVYLSLKKDELLDDIAKKYKSDKNKIISQNKLEKDIVILKKGVKLILPGAKMLPKKENRVYSLRAPKYVKNIKSNTRSNYLIWPTKGVITQSFHRGHYALDIANVQRGPIFAAMNGRVVKAKHSGWNGGYGKMIIIVNEKGMATLYAHNQKLYVKEGDVVKQGDTIAWMGRTGRVRGRNGIHLHFEVIVNGVKRNPLAYIK